MTGPTESKRAGKVSKRRALADGERIVYSHTRGVDDFVAQVVAATAMQRLDAEREGVAARFLKDVSKRMGIPEARMSSMVGLSRASAEKRVAAGEMITGRAARAALDMAQLLGLAESIVRNSTAKEAENFDSAKWLGRWIECPQPALGGKKPADFICQPAGVQLVMQMLGSMESGAYL